MKATHVLKTGLLASSAILMSAAVTSAEPIKIAINE